MKYLRVFLLALLLVGIVGFAYDAKDVMKEDEEVTKIVPFTVKMDRPIVESGKTIIVGATRAPLNEGFEGVFPPPGWLTRNENAVTGDTIRKSSDQANSGSYSCKFSSYSTYNADEWLITPPLVVTVAGADTIEWYWMTSGYNEDMQILVSTTDTALSSFSDTVVDTTINGAWNNHEISLDAYGDDTIYVAFRYISDFMYRFYLDDVTGPEAIIPPDTIGPMISELQYPVFHWYNGLDDSVIATIEDPSGVDSAFLHYNVAGWNRLDMNSIGGDDYATAIPAQPKGTRINWYIEAYDGLGNASTDPVAPYVYTYGIYPSSENLIVYESGYQGNAQELTNAFDNLGYDYDVMMEDTATTYPDSVVDFWNNLLWVTGSSGSPLDNEDVALIGNFLNYTAGADSADRHYFFLSGDDIGYDNDASRPFLEKNFRCKYIKDDLSSSDDIDTAVAILGDPITDGMPSYTFNSSYPDLVMPKARVSGELGDASYPFQIIVDADSVDTPGGLRYNGLTWVGAYLPYEMDEIEDDAARDTLVKRIMEAFPGAPMPEFVDAALLETSHTNGISGYLSGKIAGYAYEPGGLSNDFIVDVGMGPMGSPLPDSVHNWVWSSAAYTTIHNDTFEFSGQIDVPGGLLAGDFAMAYRFSYEQGPWIYADLDGFQRGFDYQYDPAMAGTLTVIDVPNVVLNEIYYDGPGTDYALYTELFGPDGASLDNFKILAVNGYDGVVYRIISLDGNTIPSDSFFVISTIDTTYMDMIGSVDWQNGDDNVVLVYAAGLDTIIVDAVGYGDYDTTSWYFVGEGMPICDVYAGHAIFRQPDGLDTDDNIQDFVASGNLTPGASNFAPLSVSIAEIQTTVNDTTPYLDSLVLVSGVITASDGYDIFIQDASGQWNGARITYIDGYPLSMGDAVTFTFSPIERNRGATYPGSETQLVDRARPQITGPGVIPDPYLTTPGDVDSSEANEGVLVELNLVTVTNDNAGFGEWIVSDGVDTCMIDDFYYYTTPTTGTVISILRGPVSYDYGYYKMEPRGDFDILSFDETIDSAFAPDSITTDSVITPYAWVGSLVDAPEDSFYTYFEVDSAGVNIHRDSIYTWVDAGGSDLITFSDWTPLFEGDLLFRYFTAATLEADPSNDTTEYPITSSGIGDISGMPTVYSLRVPGVAFGRSAIQYAVPEHAKVTLSLFDRLGRRVSVLADKTHKPGYYQIPLDRISIPAGVYFIKMDSKSFESTEKMVFVK